jgi:hypothetical protein
MPMLHSILFLNQGLNFLVRVGWSPTGRRARTFNLVLFRCEEHLYKRLRWSVGRSVRPPRCAITWKTSYVAIEIREKEEEKETDYVAIPLRRDSFAPRD